MITIIATMKIKEGKMDEAVGILKGIVENIRKSEPGCLAYIPHTVRGQDTTIIFYEKYQDKEALKTHSANLPKAMEKIIPMMEPGTDIKTCYEIM
jgi:quinol monooxygenase YgiN